MKKCTYCGKLHEPGGLACDVDGYPLTDDAPVEEATAAPKGPVDDASPPPRPPLSRGSKMAWGLIGWGLLLTLLFVSWDNLRGLRHLDWDLQDGRVLRLHVVPFTYFRSDHTWARDPKLTYDQHGEIIDKAGNVWRRPTINQEMPDEWKLEQFHKLRARQQFLRAWCLVIGIAITLFGAGFLVGIGRRKVKASQGTEARS